MYKNMIAVTNRHLVNGDFMAQMEKVVDKSPRAIILREKDITEKEYDELLLKIIFLIMNKKAQDTNHITLYIHSHISLVSKYISIYPFLGVHMSLHKLVTKKKEVVELKRQYHISISVSCHTLDEVRMAASFGADQIVLGNIFETDCKKGLPGKGLDFLAEAVSVTTLPVYGIGGITLENISGLLAAGAAGGCMMSGFMRA